MAVDRISHLYSGYDLFTLLHVDVLADANHDPVVAAVLRPLHPAEAVRTAGQGGEEEQGGEAQHHTGGGGGVLLLRGTAHPSDRPPRLSPPNWRVRPVRRAAGNTGAHRAADAHSRNTEHSRCRTAASLQQTITARTNRGR